MKITKDSKIYDEDLELIKKISIILCILSFIGGVFVGMGINIK